MEIYLPRSEGKSNNFIKGINFGLGGLHALPSASCTWLLDKPSCFPYVFACNAKSFAIANVFVSYCSCVRMLTHNIMQSTAFIFFTF